MDKTRDELKTIDNLHHSDEVKTMLINDGFTTSKSIVEMTEWEFVKKYKNRAKTRNRFRASMEVS